MWIVGIIMLMGAVPACRAVGEQAPTEESVADVFERVHTSVVTLYTVSSGPTVESYGAQVQQEGSGSGVVISADGLILTAAHVVQTAEEVEVEFHDGSIARAEILSSDPVTDLALVKVDSKLPEGLTVASLGDSDKTRIGERVFAVGAPLGISHTLTVGHLSARRLTASLVDEQDVVEVMQTDASINPGNSGGPLFDMQGEVVGVVSFITTLSGGSSGLGFAISSNTCHERFLNRPAIWSGLEFISLRGRFAELLNIPSGGSGLLIQRVVPNSLGARLGLHGGDVPAEISGLPMLLGGDIILEVGDIELESPDSGSRIREQLTKMKDEDTLRVKILRGGKQIVLRKTWKEIR